MNGNRKIWWWIICWCLQLSSISIAYGQPVPTFKKVETKIKGVNLVSKKQYTSKDFVAPLKQISANWVALTPFAFMNPEETEIEYPATDNYWGDFPNSIRKATQQARQHQLKIMLKPHIWVREQGWVGDYDLYFWQWKAWEKNFEKFILEMAVLAEELNIEIFCIGVEFKIAIQRRPSFWRKLIPKIRKIYSGQLIYAANWDEYQQVPFWDLLDYVGIDGYFPLSNGKTPSESELITAWQPIINEISLFYKKTKRRVIFTEYGYRSTDFACGNQWEIEQLYDHQLVNQTAQQNGYAAFYQSIWHQEWFAGGFIWKWHPENGAGGLNNSNYTPQQKPVLELIRNWYFNH